ncbi:hypothetical protein FDP22_19715 (plasmid) [Paroceanicella profunda]|uniref:Cytochrome b561 bacterial/Ni-hydrogenase domain-containing protein n=1 Tax=Paroceanicella profunda TaxID=2579971 RepID=A0A5B8G561_9RHOB|nr:cytochrome b/b6 domain-containing protein [Paroceanicella profunda]QDL94093.1 hypothetical protein FDP22_19715 [Paroceanicella profunda]
MSEEAQPPRGAKVLVKRHSAVTRITHWINAFTLAVMLMSGLQIFNAHPALYWGRTGQDGDPAVLSIGAVEGADGTLKGRLLVAGAAIPTTGVLGVSDVEGIPTPRAFPAWATLPGFYDLGAARHWHFFFAWLLIANGALYLACGLVSRHLRRDLAPSRDQLTPRHLGREVLDHLRLRFPKGDEARRYNALQKLTYLAVIFVLLPLIVLSGLTMSPGMTAVFPHLLDLFQGRQSARTIHFIAVSLLLLFFIVHIVMVVLSGPWNNIRSMITGRYAIRTEEGA